MRLIGTSTARDPRKVVVGALAEVVRSVNDKLHRNENGHDLLAGEPNGTNFLGDEMSTNVIQNETGAGSGATRKLKEENALREGVKRWLMCVNAERDVW